MVDDKINEIRVEIEHLLKLAHKFNISEPMFEASRDGYITAYINCLKVIQKVDKGYVGKYFMTAPADISRWNPEE